MPRPRKRDALRETWEYTLLADDFVEIDNDAEDLNPSAGTMSWRGYSYPEVAYKFSPLHEDGGINGPWWLPDDLLWKQDDLLLSILSKAVVLESVPVIKDTMLLNNSNIEIVRQETIFIPKVKNIFNGDDIKHELRMMMSSLVTCDLEKKEIRFSELVNALKEYHKQIDESFRVRMCLVKFPHRIWIEGLYHTRIHPVIVIPTNILGRYHDTKAKQQ